MPEGNDPLDRDDDNVLTGLPEQQYSPIEVAPTMGRDQKTTEDFS